MLDEVEIEGDDFADDAAVAVEILRLPAAEIGGFVVGEIFLFVFGGVVDAMAELVAKVWSEFAAPEASTIFSELDGTA